MVHQSDMSFRCHKIARKVANWLSFVKECQIQSSIRSIANSFNSINLEEDKVLISFDVSSLYTDVKVHEAIDVCTDFLFFGKYQKPLDSNQTFKKLLKISTCDVLMLTHVVTTDKRTVQLWVVSQFLSQQMVGCSNMIIESKIMQSYIQVIWTI